MKKTIIHDLYFFNLLVSMTYKQLKYYVTQKIARPFTQYKNGYTVWCDQYQFYWNTTWRKKNNNKTWPLKIVWALYVIVIMECLKLNITPFEKIHQLQTCTSTSKHGFSDYKNNNNTIKGIFQSLEIYSISQARLIDLNHWQPFSKYIINFLHFIFVFFVHMF